MTRRKMAKLVAFPLVGSPALQLRLENDDKIRDELKRVMTHLIPRVMDDALYKSAAKVPFDISTSVREYYTLPARTIKDDTEIVESFAPKGWAVHLNYRPHTAMQYQGRQIGKRRHRRGLGRGKGWAGLPISRRHGFTWKIYKAGPVLWDPTGFVWRTTTSGGKEVQIPFRRPQKVGNVWPRKLKKVIYGPSLGGIFSVNSKYGPTIRENVRLKFNERLYTEMQRAVHKYSRWM